MFTIINTTSCKTKFCPEEAIYLSLKILRALDSWSSLLIRHGVIDKHRLEVLPRCLSLRLAIFVVCGFRQFIWFFISTNTCSYLQEMKISYNSKFDPKLVHWKKDRYFWGNFPYFQRFKTVSLTVQSFTVFLNSFTV